MLFSERIVSDAAYRNRKLQTCADDRPLIVQLQGNEPSCVASAAALVQASLACDAIDLNLGCPLAQAESGCFGSYLLAREHWPRVAAIIRAMVDVVSLPVCAKVRLLSTADETADLCRTLLDAGCSMLAIHARPRPAVGRHRGERNRCAADLETLRHVIAALPRGTIVLANGNTERPSDVSSNLAYTGAAGVMSAEGVLRNPLLFEAAQPAACLAGDGAVDDQDGAAGDGLDGDGFEVDGGERLPREQLASVALEYLALCHEHMPEDMSVVRGHLMWMLGKSGKGHRCTFDWLGPYTPQQLRMALVEATGLEELEQIVRATLLA